MSRPILLPCLLAVVAGALAAQPVVTPTPDPPAEIEQTEAYSISNTFEVGYRFHDVSGNHDVYRAAVNFGNGPRLLEGQLRINSLQGQGTLVDELSLNTFGAGNDPYQSTILRAEKFSVFRYDMQFRIVDYFNRLPSLWSGEHGVNSRRTFQNHDLILFPGQTFELLLGYDRYDQDGPGFSSEAVNQDFRAFEKGNFLRLTTDLRRQNNQYRGGFNFRFGGLVLTAVQAFDNYKEDTRYGDGSFLVTGAENVQSVTSLQRDEPIHGNTPVTTVSLRTENENRVGFHGRYVYSGGNRDFVLAEDVTAAGSGLVPPAQRQPFVLGKARRAQGNGDFTVTLMPGDRWTVTNTTAINNTRISGDALFVEATASTSRFTEFEELGIRHITNATEVNFRPVRKLGLYAAYRFSTRRIQSRQNFQFPGSEFDVPLFEQNNGIHSGVAGVRWFPLRRLRVSVDVEAGNADLPFTPVSDKQFHSEAVRVQWRKNGVVLGGHFKSRDNDNSASLINHSSTSRSHGFNGSWSPSNGRVTLDAGYTKLEIDTASGIFNFFAPDPQNPPGRSFYTSNLHNLHFGSMVRPHNRLTLYLGYNLARDTGADFDTLRLESGFMPAYPNIAFDGTNFFNSFPLTYQSPQARLSVSLSDWLAWNFGWQFYNYEERFTGDQNYNAHVGYSSFRWSF